jgi:cytochrome b6-f complex iron-sulfur subunit
VTAVEPTTDHAKPRREVLCGLVVALLAPGALVAACGDSNSSGSGGAPAGGSGGGSGGGAGSKLAALDDVPQGGGLVVSNPAGGKILLVRTSAEQVKAYNAACTHQGTTVNPPQGTTITCPNHGSQFDSTTGAVKRGPATSPLRAVSVKVDGTNVVLA